MCRLFAFVAPQSSAVDRQLGRRGIESLLSLAQVHGDGWGWSGVDAPGASPSLHKSALSASTDTAFAPTLATDARAAMVHLRWATSGMVVQADNTHPFLDGGISFEHNGSLKPVDRARALLAEESLAGMHGQTDSEMYFALVRERYAAAGRTDLAAAVLAAVTELRAAFPVSSLNAIVLDADELIVVHASARSALDSDDLTEILAFDLPDEHAEDYFALRWLTKEDGTIVIGSTGVAGADWEDIPAESVVSIRLSDGRTTVTPVEPVAAS